MDTPQRAAPAETDTDALPAGASGCPGELRAQVSELVGGAWEASRLDWARDARAAHGSLSASLSHDLARRATAAGGRDGGAAARLQEAHRLACAVAEATSARLETWERLRAALLRLADLGPASELIAQAAAEAAAVGLLDRVVLSRLEGGRILAEAVHVDGDAGTAAALLLALREDPVRVAYPLVEGEIVRRRRAVVVGGHDGEAPVRSAFAGIMRSSGFVAVPIVLGRRVIGFLHGDRPSGGGPLAAQHRDGLQLFSEGFVPIFERVVLRQRMRTQRQEIRRIASWADARTSELGDRAIDLGAGLEGGEPGPASAPDTGQPGHFHELLTRRELDVLERMACGETNAEIAQALVVSEGTVKFHVKNVLRKMQASNRAEASSKYLRAQLTGSAPDHRRRM